MNINDINHEIREARSMPKSTPEEKEARSTAMDMAKNKKYAKKTIEKYFSHGEPFEKPDYSVLDGYYTTEDECDVMLKELYQEQQLAKKNKDYSRVSEIKAKIKEIEAKRKEARAMAKATQDAISIFARAAKPYLSAETMLKQMENYSHFDEIAAGYDEAKVRAEAAEKAEAERQAQLAEEEKALKAARKSKK